MSKEKTHYRNVFKSDHLGVADLEDMIEKGDELIFTIDKVKQELGVSVAGRKGNHNIAYFKEKGIKPLVLNATNSAMVKKFCGKSPFVEDWNNVIITLFIDPSVKMKGDVVGGVRIRPAQPVIKKEDLTPSHKRWDAAKQAFQEGKKESVLSQFNISEENINLLQSL